MSDGFARPGSSSQGTRKADGHDSIRVIGVKRMRAFLTLTITVMLCGTSLEAQSDELQMRCGDTVITALPAKTKGGETYLRNFKITLSNKYDTKEFEFSPENDFLNLNCFYSATSKFLVINHFCGGSGCAESNYGVVELPSFRVLLTPGNRWRGNESVALTILGTTPPHPNCETKSTTHLCLNIEED